MQKKKQEKPIKIIIFDLDDTLIDTSKFIIPPVLIKIHKFLLSWDINISYKEFMKERRYFLKNFPNKNFFSYLFSLNKNKWMNSNLKHKIIKETEDKFYNSFIKSKTKLLKDSRGILNNLNKKYILYMVTYGNTRIQQKKIKQVKITDFFKKIYIINNKGKKNKKDIFKLIKKQHDVHPGQILCVGDRLDKEIFYANTLKFATCYLKYGEHRHYVGKNNKEKPDFTINHLNEIIKKCRL